MAFPTSPARGDTYVQDNTTYTFNGVAWDRTLVGADNGVTYTSRATLTAGLSGADGGYEFSGAFEDRRVQTNGEVLYTASEAASNTWRRFGFSESANTDFDNPYFSTEAGYDSAKGLFGGTHMPAGVTNLFDFDDTSFASAGTLTSPADPYTAAGGSLDFRQCRVGDLLRLRFDFNVTPQQANTTLEICLIWATRNDADEVTFDFPLTAQPVFFGTGTVGRTMLNRVEISAYFASSEDVNARALPAIRADNEIIVAPLSCLATIIR